MGYRTLNELEDAQQQTAAAARQWIEDAGELVNHYRSQIFQMQETFHQHATHREIVKDPAFQAGLQTLSEEAAENIRTASQAIFELEEDYSVMTARHTQEREDFRAP